MHSCFSRKEQMPLYKYARYEIDDSSVGKHDVVRTARPGRCVSRIRALCATAGSVQTPAQTPRQSVPHPLAYIEMGVPTPPRHLVLSFTTATSGAYAVGTWMQQSSIMINVFRVDIFKCRGSRSAAEEARHTKQIVNQVHEAAAPGRI